MIGVQGIVANDRNAVNAGAVITTTNVKAVANAVRRLPTARQGNGFATLAGSYSGMADSIYEVEVVDDTVTVPLISKPTLSGQGSGEMSAIAFTGSAQAFSIELTDLGNILTTAAASLEGIKIVARNPGFAGNTLRLEVTESGLLYTATPFSLIQDLKTGTKSSTNNAFDWQSVVVGPDKVIPLDAKRVAFGADRSSIYLQYKTYQNTGWSYNFEPQISKNVSKGTPVFFVTGGRTVTITNGTVTETYANIISIYDLLNAVQTGSALVRIEGVVSNDRRPGGQGVKEFTLRTQAYMAENAGTGSTFATGFESVIVNQNAFTEIIEARCYAVSGVQAVGATLGHELWELRGSLSGLLRTDLATDEVYTEPVGRFSLKIPKKLPPGFGAPRGRFSVTGINYAPRQNVNSPLPPICVVAMNLGPEAVDQQVVLRYRQRPSAGCECGTMAIPDTNTLCLGLEGEVQVSIIADRIINAYNYRKNHYLAIYDSNAPYANLQLEVADYLTKFEADFNEIVGLLKQLVDVPDMLARWDLLWDDFINETTQVISVAGGGAAAPATYTITVDTQNVGHTLPHYDVSNVVVTDSNAAVIPPASYQVDPVEGTIQLVASTAGFLLPYTVTYDTDLGRTRGSHVIQMTNSATVPSQWQDIDGINIDHVKLTLFNVGVMPRATRSPRGITTAAQLYEVDEVNGRIRFLIPAAAYEFYVFKQNTAGNLSFGDTVYYVPGTAPPSTIVIPSPSRDFMPSEYGKIRLRLYGRNTTNENYTIVSEVNVPPANIFAEYVGAVFTITISGITTISPPSAPHGAYQIFATDTSFEMREISTSNVTVQVHPIVQYERPKTNVSGGGTPTLVLTLPDYLERREAWQEWGDAIRADAGKFDANTGEQQLGDGCWRDSGDSLYWEVTGSVGGSYQPAFNNRPYYSSKNNTSTKEFAFQLNIKCPHLLLPGDTITFSVGDAGLPATYQINDSLVLSTVASQPLQLAGGQDGDNTQTWVVSGSVAGALPAYSLVTTAPVAYSQSGLSFLITPGAVPFEKGDKFTFAVEGGHWRWRQDGGAWSALSDITTTAPTLLSNGLSLSFATGVSPSFRPADLFKFQALQPYSPNNVRRPTPLVWRWEGASATLNIDFGSVKTISAVALLHKLPVGANVTITDVPATWSVVFAVTVPNVLMADFVALTASQVVVTITNAPDGAIDWLWIGDALTTEYSAEVAWARDYRIEHGAGFNPGGLYLGKAGTGEVKWNELVEADRIKIEAMLDHIKMNGDEPMILFPQRLRPNEAMFARVVPDEIDLVDEFTYQPDDGAARRYSLTLPLKGVFL
jgi:hypothetical protein